MRSLRLGRILGVAVLLSSAVASAGQRVSVLPHRYAPQSLDGPLAQVTNSKTGLSWAAWAYRNGAEYDVALAYRSGSGAWSEPLFFGGSDGKVQSEPTLAVDSDGTVYLAYTDATDSRILLSALRFGSTRWTAPRGLSTSGVRVASPMLRVVENRVIVGYRIGGRVNLIDLPLAGPLVLAEGVIDNPDPNDRNLPPDLDGDGVPDWEWPPDDSGATTKSPRR